jgi:hypothetical protein
MNMARALNFLNPILRSISVGLFVAQICGLKAHAQSEKGPAEVFQIPLLENNARAEISIFDPAAADDLRMLVETAVEKNPELKLSLGELGLVNKDWSQMQAGLQEIETRGSWKDKLYSFMDRWNPAYYKATFVVVRVVGAWHSTQLAVTKLNSEVNDWRLLHDGCGGRRDVGRFAGDQWTFFRLA